MRITSTSENGVKLIKHYEGFKSKAYVCPAGVVTIGYGTTYYPDGQRVRITDTCTEQQASEWLKTNLKIYEKEVDVMTRDDISQRQFDALVSFAYNLGGNALRSSTLLKKVNKNPNDPTISQEFAKWVKAGGKTLRGLVTRRVSEAKLYATGKLDI